MKNKKYLVATDLSEASDKALLCAAKLAKKFDSEVILLHVFEVADVDESAKRMMSSSFLNRDIKRQLQESVQEVAKTEGIKITYLTKEGELFSMMDEAAIETGSDILFIGTHGVHGVQHLTGAFIAKTINTVSIPVWVIQKDTPLLPYENIVVYVDEYPEEALHIKTLELAQSYGTAVHFVFTEPADAFTVSDMIKKTSARLDAESISYTFKNVSQELDKQKALLDIALEMKAPLIVFDRNQDNVDTQVPIITNKQNIEVLCLNTIS
jgi:nucleotide-binding universal stress UspA family protein